MRVDRTVEFRQLTDGIKVPVYKRSAIAPNDPQITPLIKKLNEEAKSILRHIRVLGRSIRTRQTQKNYSIELDSCLEDIARIQTSTDTIVALGKPKASWFASNGPEESQLELHLTAIVWYLNHNYSKASRDYEQMKASTRKQDHGHLKQAQEMRSIALSSIPQKLSSPVVSPVEDKVNLDVFSKKYGLSDQQMQMLQREKHELYNELADTQAQMKHTERSVHEIARLQTTLQESLLYQEAQIERIYDDIDIAADMVQKGNKFLNKASSRQSTFAKIMVFFILFMTGIMLFMHFYLD